ncbi:MAG: hypothetical protein AB7G21_14985 [Dehalococcoidia bacterium]
MPDVGMFGDNGPALDPEAIDEAVRDADVIVLGFDFTPDRLLIDLRDDPRGHTPPIVELVEPLNDAGERQIWLSARRPGLRAPEQLLFFVWPHSVAYLAASPLLSGAVRRIDEEQGVDVHDLLADALDDLRGRERTDLLAAVRGGEGFETLWSRA